MKEDKEHKERKPRRTHKELTDTLFGAVSSMLSDQKFREIGINDLTEFAKVEKNFIYKHYGDMDGLLREYVKRNDYWGKSVLSRDTYEQLTLKQILHVLLQGLYTNFADSVDFQNIIRWEIASSNEYVKQNARVRESEGLELIKYAEAYSADHPDKDITCLFALLSAGVYYLILHKNISTFTGIDFSDKKQSDRLLGVLSQIIDLYFEEDKNKGIVKRLLERGNSVQDIAAILDLTLNQVETIKSNI